MNFTKSRLREPGVFRSKISPGLIGGIASLKANSYISEVTLIVAQSVAGFREELRSTYTGGKVRSRVATGG